MLNKIYRGLIYGMPLALFLSYYPVIGFGHDETMNFELSVPLIWLVVFDVVAFMILAQRRILKDLLKLKWFLVFPLFVTVSLLWSSNVVRGILTVGIMWLLYFAVFAFWSLRDLMKDEKAKRSFWRWFFGAALVICAWCFVQCILDVMGVSRERTLMCAGCTSWMFGFPHPNGLAIEPQFMGNLLIAPAVMSAWLYISTKQNSKNLKQESSRGDNFDNRSVGAHTKLQFRDSLRDCCKNYSGSDFLSSKFLLFCFFIFTATLFLTFSRGAIYAFGVAMIFMVAMWSAARCLARTGKLKQTSLSVFWNEWFRATIKVWAIVILAFLFTLNVQGIMTEFGPTNDTYFDGVAKVLNHLSLGIIDVRQGKSVENEPALLEETMVYEAEMLEIPPEETQAFRPELVEGSENEAVFDGYVEESTEIRKMMTRNALHVWRKDFGTMMFGVGIGGAGQAMYDAGLIGSPKEIVQNQYVSLLLEIGIIGLGLAVLTVVLIVMAVAKSVGGGAILTLMVAYGVSLVFFAGLPNALHIYLLPGIIYIVLRKKLVS